MSAYYAKQTNRTKICPKEEQEDYVAFIADTTQCTTARWHYNNNNNNNNNKRQFI